MMCLSRKVFSLAVVLTVAFLLVFVSCSSGGGGGGGGKRPSTPSTPTNPTNPNAVTETFYAINTNTNRYYSLKADRLVQGTHCTVWVEQGSGVSEADAKSLANEFDTKIYSKMIENFNLNKQFTFNGKNYSNAMEFADAIGDGDGKLCILMLDIRDSYRAGVNEGYVAGFFYPGDLMARDSVNNPNPNMRDMIYIDTNPGFVGNDKKENAYKTLAHEMQHLMNFVTSIGIRSSSSGSTLTSLRQMDLWIDEGLSSAAEWVYLGEHTDERWQYVNNLYEQKGSIDKGNNFFVWGNSKGSANYDIMDEYYTVYLFFQWLRLQYGNNSIYRSIISSDKSDYQAVTNVSGLYTADWATLLRDWYVASYINDTSGVWGYKDELELRNVKFPFTPASASATISLYPGEGVISYNTNPSRMVPTGVSGNIRYAGLNRGAKNVIESGNIPSGEALLTYNVSTISASTSAQISASKAETGTITGTAGPAPVKPTSIVMSTVLGSAPSAFKGPYPIGAHDVLRQNGHKSDSSVINLSLSIKEAEGE